MSRSLARRAGLALVTGSLALTGVVTAPSATAAPAGDAAGWLSSELQDGPFQNGFGGTDFGLTIDAGTALLEINREARAGEVRDTIESGSSAYYEGSGDDAGATYSNGLAKLTSFVLATDGDARSFDGRDLVERLGDQVRTRGAAEGRIVDSSIYGDYANSLGQSFAARALHGAGSPLANKATKYLLLQQCDEGYFRLNMGKLGARQQSCDTARPKKSRADLDTTAINVLNLQEIAQPGRKVKRSIRSGVAWLADQQRRNGSFGGSAPTTVSNSNSTGLAAWALGQSDRCGAAARAASWVRGRQLDNGAVAYTRAAFRAAQDEGITAETRDQFRRSTSQAAPGLEYARTRICRA